MLDLEDVLPIVAEPRQRILGIGGGDDLDLRRIEEALLSLPRANRRRSVLWIAPQDVDSVVATVEDLVLAVRGRLGHCESVGEREEYV